MDSEVRAAVEDAYRIFGQYRVADGIADAERDGVVGPLEARLMALTPPREMTLDIVADYFTACEAGGELHVAKAILPRLLELIADGAIVGPGPTAVGFLRRAAYRASWPGEESATIDRYFEQVFAAARRDGGDPVAALDLIAAGGGDLDALIAVWLAEAGPKDVRGRLSRVEGDASRPWAIAALATIPMADAAD